MQESPLAPIRMAHETLNAVGKDPKDQVNYCVYYMINNRSSFTDIGCCGVVAHNREFIRNPLCQGYQRLCPSRISCAAGCRRDLERHGKLPLGMLIHTVPEMIPRLHHNSGTSVALDWRMAHT